MPMVSPREPGMAFGYPQRGRALVSSYLKGSSCKNKHAEGQASPMALRSAGSSLDASPTLGPSCSDPAYLHHRQEPTDWSAFSGKGELQADDLGRPTHVRLESGQTFQSGAGQGRGRGHSMETILSPPRPPPRGTWVQRDPGVSRGLGVGVGGQLVGSRLHRALLLDPSLRHAAGPWVHHRGSTES